MAGSSRRPLTPPHAASSKAKDLEEQLPKVECIGLVAQGRGWVVVHVTVQGEKVLDKEVLSVEAEPKGIAFRRAEMECIKLWFRAQADA